MPAPAPILLGQLGGGCVFSPLIRSLKAVAHSSVGIRCVHHSLCTLSGQLYGGGAVACLPKRLGMRYFSRKVASRNEWLRQRVMVERSNGGFLHGLVKNVTKDARLTVELQDGSEITVQQSKATKRSFPTSIQFPEKIYLPWLAKSLGMRTDELEQLLDSVDDSPDWNDSEINPDIAEIVLLELGVMAQRWTDTVDARPAQWSNKQQAQWPVRSPVVTVMGHVDHGKTSLLDAIRSTSVAAGEKGGITQHIGAFSATTTCGNKITFIDTPGHEAFTAMRARGANATDIVVLVVAADDGVMPQTVEAISHAQACKVPIVVAINKMDAPGANPEKVREELMRYGLIPEELGGDVQMVEVSALRKTGLQQLEELLVLNAEMLDLRAPRNTPAEGVVLEVKQTKALGVVVTVLVSKGILGLANILVAGKSMGKVKAMVDEKGYKQTAVLPSQAVEVMGFKLPPQVGDTVLAVAHEARAREVVEWRQAHFQKAERERKAQNSGILPLIIKADALGSAEAVLSVLEQLPSEKLQPEVLHCAVGGITDSDILLANASQGAIIAFNLRIPGSTSKLAKRSSVPIVSVGVIYRLLEAVEQLMLSRIEPEFEEVEIGRAQVVATFTVKTTGVKQLVAGLRVESGEIHRSDWIQILRQDQIIHQGGIVSIRREKEVVNSVAKGNECGIVVEGASDVDLGDSFVALRTQAKELTL